MIGSRARALVLALAAGGLCVSPRPVVAQQPTITNIPQPDGRHVLYARYPDQASPPALIGRVLSDIHRQCGERPTVGKPFQLKGSNSIAVFFSVVNRNAGNVARAGMIIASGSGDDMEVALISDDAAKFGANANPMLKTLFAQWHPGGAAPSGAPSAAANAPRNSAPAAALRPFMLPDHSASVSLPEGWAVQPGSGGGSIMAKGPNGEEAFLGAPLMAMNSRDPRVQQTMRFAQSPAGRNTSYAQTSFYPYGMDPARTFIDLIQMNRSRSNMGQARIQFSSGRQLGGRCSYMSGQIDAPELKGTGEISVVFCIGQLDASGSYMNLATFTIVPVPLADRERATMGAMMESFQVNMNVVNAQASALAAPGIAAIHEIGRQAAQRSADADAWREDNRRSFEARQNSQDRAAQGFSNYLLDQTVIQDNNYGTHGTTWSSTADAMVKADPNRFQYVNTPNFWKGVDY